MSLTQAILDFLSAIPPEAIVLIIAMIPFIELRGAIPIAVGIYGMPLWYAFVLSVIGNLIPVPFILLFLKDIEKWLRRYDSFNRFFDWLYARTRDRAGERIKKYEELGVMLFVAIPLPMTGAWTGSLIAYLFGLRLKRSFMIIALGVIIAGIIVSSLVWLGIMGAKTL